MDIKNKVVIVTLIVCSLLFDFTAFSQNEIKVKREMIRYSVECKLKPELDKIINQLKSVDQKLIFTIDTSIEDNICQISLTTSYDVEVENNCIGFCEYRGKQFLLKSIASEMFFTRNGKDVVYLNARNSKKSNDIVQPYIDNLPYWLLEYHNGVFETKLSSY